MKRCTRGGLISVGGIAWLVGVLVLETWYQESTDSFPVAFPILALFAGASAGWGIWSLIPSLDTVLARVGGRLLAVSTMALGAGFGLELLPFDDGGIGFLMAYSFALFVLPASYLIFGLGVISSKVFSKRAKWVPISIAGAAAINYGFHALAPEVWDPPDFFWFTCIGLGWLVLSVSRAAIEQSQHLNKAAMCGPLRFRNGCLRQFVSSIAFLAEG